MSLLELKEEMMEDPSSSGGGGGRGSIKTTTSSTIAGHQIDDAAAAEMIHRPHKENDQAAPEEALVMGPLMKNLLWYLEESSEEPSDWEYDVDICAGLPWNRDTIMFVLSYVFHFISNLEEHSDISAPVMALDDIAKCVHDLTERTGRKHEIDTKQAELSEMLLNSFFPDVVRRFFTVPKLHQLPPSDNHLYPNEIIAGFMDFLLQVLYHQTNISEDQVQLWEPVWKELSFLLAVLGDIPFQCSHHHEIVQETKILLAEFEMLANDAGSFLYDDVFSIHQMESNKFHEETTAWFQKVEFLNAKIKEHCLKFSELPMSVISRSSVVDSFFIIHSLIEDIENLKNHTLNINHDDAILELMRELHRKLSLSLSFIEDMRDNEEEEDLIQIRDLTYEAEYLINSLAVGNIDGWYLNLRLPSIVHRIKFALIKLQQTETKFIKASDGEVSFPTTGNAATIEENHFSDFTDDITQTIFSHQSNCMKILEHGYNHLPRNIKPCFLYFAGFPEDSEISQEKLTWLWISEGFIPKQAIKSPEEIAEMYLLDLINRGLLIAETELDGAKKHCRINSQLHEYVVEKANEENFIKFTNRGFSMYERCQRLCVPSTESCNYWRPFGLHCRSYRDLRTQHEYSSCFQTMALLKVVDQSPEYYGSRPFSALAFPTQLRYLAVVCNLSSKMVANLVNLELLYANIISEDRFYVPSVVLRMVKLRHLVVKWSAAEFEEDWCSNITETTDLRTLSGVRIIQDKDEDILRCSPHLHKLKCSFTDKTRFPDLSFLPELESLIMYFENGLNAKILSTKINIPLTIKKLSLGGSGLPWEMTSILGRLPNLIVLKLEEDAFKGDVWVTRDGEFQKLKFLKLYNSVDLRLWISCSEHFPVLECLVLSCRALLEIPSDFINIQTLQRIKVERCTKQACLSALQFGKHIQVDIASDGWEKEELLQKCTNMTLDDLKDMFSCMEEYSQARCSEGFINKLPIIIDQTEDDKTTDEDAFVLRDVLSYMEQYFQAGATEESKMKLKIIDQAEDEMTTTAAHDEPLIFVNQRTYFMVFSYAMKFSTLENHPLSDIILGLRCISASYISIKLVLPGHPCYVDEIKKTRIKFVNFLISQVQRLFQVLKMEQLPDKQHVKGLKKNEILASFMDFLLQMFSEVNTDQTTEAKQYALMKKELSFLLAVLGDLPFQPTNLPEFDDQVNNLLVEFEMIANEAGSFLFSCVFPIEPMKVSRFHVETNVLLEKAKLLNTKIKEHCTNFSGLHVSVIVRSTIVDSFFIIDSLIEDLHNIIMNGQLGNFSSDDALMEQIITLQGELTLSQSLIKVMRDNDGNKKKEGLIQIRDLTYEAEYLIGSLVVGNIHVWYLNLRLPSIVCKIKLVRSELQQTSETVIEDYDEEVSYPTIDDNAFLDFNQDITRRMLNDLTGISNTPRKTITIFGMPGLGKTTTATNLYNSKAALSRFDRRAWCVVSAKYNVRALFIQILLDLANGSDMNREWKEDDAELGLEIHQTLKGRRYLIVLDDVWYSDVLDELTIYFPDDGNGSRVLITTRNKVVSPDGSILYELPILSKDHCWNLLEKKVFPEDPCPSHLVNVGKRIAARCSGIPLAVVSIAGVLVNVERVESEWKKVEEQLEKILLDDQSDYSYRKIMELSYEHLPQNIKPCFLYFARYPEDTKISTKELKWFWVTQGFVQKDGNKSPEEIAETYLSDLINRSLVMTAEIRSIGGTKTCRIHDLLHDICRKKAGEENFMKSTNSFSTYEKHQHLCLLSSSKDINWRPFGLHCRSFRGCETERANFRTMALVKLVDLMPEQKHCFQYLSKVDLPFQLRYLGISDELISKDMWDHLASLEVLHIRGGYGVEVVVPSVILRMAKLRHLLVRDKAKFEEDCSDNISETTNLRSISRVVIEKKSDEEILRKSPHLRTLKCLCRGEIVFPDLSALAELKSVRIGYPYDFSGEILLSESSFPSTIKKLCLIRSKLAWEKMSIIGRLPMLEVLKLEWGAFVGKEWETNDDEFQELRFLKIDGLGLKQWSSESSHFPSLEKLVLSRCKYLVEIPCDFGYIPTLQKIEVKYCEKEACLSAIEIEKEQHEFGNPELQVDIIHKEWTK